MTDSHKMLKPRPRPDQLLVVVVVMVVGGDVVCSLAGLLDMVVTAGNCRCYQSVSTVIKSFYDLRDIWHN